MAERIQVNFGWLNDYSGAKFAPLTLSDKVLMTNSDKTFDTYINEIIAESRNRHTATENNVNMIKKTLKALDNPFGTFNDYPRDYPQNIPENQSLILDVFGANRLINLNGHASTEGKSAADIYAQYGVDGGNALTPTYFEDGLPVACTSLSTGSAPVSLHTSLYIDYDNERDYPNIRQKHPEYEINDDKKNLFYYGEFTNDSSSGQPISLDWSHGTQPQGLKINIKGNARSATEALFSFQAGLAKESLQADLAEEAIALTRDLVFSDTSPTSMYSKASSHIDGLIDFEAATNLANPIEVGLKLREIIDPTSGASRATKDTNNQTLTADWLGTEVSFNPDNAPGTGANGFGVKKPIPSSVTPTAKEAFYVPHVRVDTTGRVIEVTQEAIKPKLNTAHYDNVTGTKQAALLGYLRVNESESYIVGQSSDGQQGVYIDWETNEPVIMGAAWNDYAEFRKQKEEVPAGYCVASNDNGEVYKTTKKFEACDGIVSDTYGFSIGKSDEYRTPLAVSGRVLAYYNGKISEYHAGDTVCAGPEGKVCKMTREEIREWPDRIVGIVSEIPSEEKWNNIPTKDRIWIKVK